MALQAVILRRCAACDRWDGARSVGDEAGFVRIASETDSGRCVGGPWDGSERRARAACGRWTRWQQLPPETANEGSSPPAPTK